MNVLASIRAFNYTRGVIVAAIAAIVLQGISEFVLNELINVLLQHIGADRFAQLAQTSSTMGIFLNVAAFSIPFVLWLVIVRFYFTGAGMIVPERVTFLNGFILGTLFIYFVQISSVMIWGYGTRSVGGEFSHYLLTYAGNFVPYAETLVIAAIIGTISGVVAVTAPTTQR